MKFNKWTMGLAALGAVSLASVAQAEERVSALQTTLSSTTISGYIDTSAQWNVGTGTFDASAFGGAAKQDGFNLNVVQLTISKDLDESEWAAGYRGDLWFGPDATTLASQFTAGGDLAIRQAYVALRAPVGNGLDFKMGVFDTIVGYESLESGNNPNMTRSFGFGLEPTTHTGLLASYRFSDMISASAGIANTYGPTINGRAFGGTPASANRAESYKTYMASLALTAPSDWGWVAGSSLYAGFITGYDSTAAAPGGREHYYTGLTLATPVAGLTLGTAFDYSHVRHVPAAPAAIDDQYAIAVYASFQATEKLSLHGRGDFLNQESSSSTSTTFYSFTLTAQYDLWENVISRAEVRWDHAETAATGYATKDSVMVAANIIYKF